MIAMFVELSGFLRVNQGTVDGANAIHALEGAAGHLLRCRDFFPTLQVVGQHNCCTRKTLMETQLDD